MPLSLTAPAGAIGIGAPHHANLRGDAGLLSAVSDGDAITRSRTFSERHAVVRTGARLAPALRAHGDSDGSDCVAPLSAGLSSNADATVCRTRFALARVLWRSPDQAVRTAEARAAHTMPLCGLSRARGGGGSPPPAAPPRPKGTVVRAFPRCCFSTKGERHGSRSCADGSFLPFTPGPSTHLAGTLVSSAMAAAGETANSMLDRESSAARVPDGVMARWRFIGSSAAHPSSGAPRA